MKLIRPLITLAGILISSIALAENRPNILWIVVEDMSCHFGFQGEQLVETPNVDRLAAQGIIFSNAYVTAPVCSASRSAMITGMYQTTIGAHHHRSSRGPLKIELPDGIRTTAELFHDAGYYTCNLGFAGSQAERRDRYGKEDYNFDYIRADLYDGPDWSGRADGQPFFAQIQLRGGKLRNVPKWYDEVTAGVNRSVTAAEVNLPPYYPDHPAFRKDWAEYLNAVQYTDKEIGMIVERLEREQLVDNTIVFVITDHGISQARGKQFLYDEGTKIPFIVFAPKQIPGGSIRSESIAHIDMAATSLGLAGIEIPKWMQARSLFGPNARPRDYVVSARDRCDETVDRIRSVRRGDYKYIRNDYPQRPYLQPCAYKDHKPFMQPLRDLFEAGQLTEAQSLQLATTRPSEELYDLKADPFEVNNLAGDPVQADRLRSFRSLLEQWEASSNDQGRFPENDAMYDSDMKAYLSPGFRKKNPQQASQIEANIALMKKWKAEGI